MQELEVNAIATILIGPFVDKGDGVTPEEGVTLAAADSAEVMKHNGTSFVDIAGAGANQATLLHKEKGMYTLIIPAAVISDEGRLTVFISDESVCLPVWKDFMVVSQAYWASKYDAKDSGYMDVDIKAVGGTATPHTSGKLHILQGDGNAITAAGPTKTQMDNGHAALTTPAEVASELETYDAVKRSEATDDKNGVIAAIPAMVGTDGAALESSWTSALATILANFTSTRIGYLDQLDFTLQEAIAAIKGIADKLDSAMESDAAVYRFTENALEEAPGGNGGDATATNQELLIQILTGKWEVTGNQLIIYDTDGETALYTFDLTQNGVPTEYNPDLRTPV